MESDGDNFDLGLDLNKKSKENQLERQSSDYDIHALEADLKKLDNLDDELTEEQQQRKAIEE